MPIDPTKEALEAYIYAVLKFGPRSKECHETFMDYVEAVAKETGKPLPVNWPVERRNRFYSQSLSSESAIEQAQRILKEVANRKDNKHQINGEQS